MCGKNECFVPATPGDVTKPVQHCLKRGTELSQDETLGECGQWANL